jgi:hypothetical protein
MGVVVERSRPYTQRPPFYDYTFRVSIRRAAQIQNADASLVVKAKYFLRGEHLSKGSMHVQRSPAPLCLSICKLLLNPAEASGLGDYGVPSCDEH